MHRASGHAKLFGRVAALAVAFGVGVAVATAPGVAWADDDSTPAQPSSPDASDPGQDSPDSPAQDSPGPADTGVTAQDPSSSAPDTGTATTVAVGDSPEVTYGVSGGAQFSEAGGAEQGSPADVVEPAPAAPVAAPAPAPVEAAAPAATRLSIPTIFGPLHIDLPRDSGAASRGEGAAPAPSLGSAVPTGAAIPFPYQPPGDLGTVVVPMTSRMASASPSGQAVGESAMVSKIDAAATHPAGDTNGLMAIPSTLLNIATGLVAAVLAPLVIPGGPASPTDTPLLWAVLGWARKQFGAQRPVVASFAPDATTELGNVKITLSTTDVAPVGTAHPMQTLAESIATPSKGLATTTTPRFGDTITTVDPDTGWVTGWVFAQDPDDESVSYGGTGPTPKGDVIVYEDASFLYKPSVEARRVAAALGGDQDTFTVTISDDRSGDRAVPVTVDVLPAV